MFEAPKIEHTHAAVRAATDKHIDALGTEADIIDFLIVSNQLCFGC